MATPPPRPLTARVTMLAAGLAAPLALLATWAIALLTIVVGLLKLVPSGDGQEPASASLLRLATGGLIEAPWGQYLVGVLQIVLGIGLLWRPFRAAASLGYLLYAVAVVVGGVMNRSALISNGNLNATGLALVLLVVVLLAGAAFGARGAAKQLGAAA